MQQYQTEDAIKSIVTDYLNNQDTDYAIMITGNWGCGKTYYCKNELFKFIENLPGKERTKNPYKPIYVSLYGLESIDNILERIISSEIPILENKVILLAKAGLLNVVKHIGASDETITRVKDLKGINKNDVLFFDDLERIDKTKIDIQSVLGYLNYLTEHDHYKIIIIANDEKLDDNFWEFKEKTVRFTYNLTPNLSEIFDTILKKHEKEKEYHRFWEKQKKLIITIFNASSCKNIRTLIFITDIYIKIFQEISGKYKDEINSDLLTTFTVLSIEAKEGNDRDELSNCIKSLNNTISVFDDNKKSSETNEDSTNNGYKNLLKEKYSTLNINHLTFYPELFDLVFDGYTSPKSINSIVEGIRTQYIQKESSKSQIFVSQISNWTSIDDKELPSIINNIKTAVSNGDYGVYDILKTYAYLCQIEGNGIIELKDEDTDSFNKAIKNAMDTEYSPLFDLQAIRWDESEKSPAKEKYEKLRLYALEINDNNQHKAKQKAFLCMIKENGKEKFSEFMSEPSNWESFIEIDPKEIAIAISSASNEFKIHFYNGLRLFFPVNIQATPDMLKKNVNFLENIKKHINEHTQEQKEKTISEFNIKRICTYIDKVLSSYNYILQHRN